MSPFVKAMQHRTVVFYLGWLSLFMTHSGWAQKNESFDARAVQVSWQLGQNRYQEKPQFLASLTLKNTSATPVPTSGWKLYFSLRYHDIALTSLNPNFTIQHVNGDLFYIAPTTAFHGLGSGESARMDFVGGRRIGNYQDVPSGLFWVNDAAPQQAIALKTVSIGPLPEAEKWSFADAARAYADNQYTADIPESALPKILPAPVRYQEDKGSFVLSGAVTISTDPSFLPEANYLAEELQRFTGRNVAVNPSENKSATIRLQRATMTSEAYQLVTKGKQILITAADGAGIFYGIQSLKELLPPTVWQSPSATIQLPIVTVSDAPRFAYRGFMLDVGRNFHRKEAILKLLDVMALYKLNVFHFHLTDDEGWRLEIPGLPELTTVGAKRGYPFAAYQQLQPSYGSGADAEHSYGSGFYTKADFIEILRYATQRHIRVIPELEMPGHARAAIKAMRYRYETYRKVGNETEANRFRLDESQDSSHYSSPQRFNDNVMNIALPSTYQFVEKVIDEVRRMYTEAGASLSMMHVGGDEVPHGAWEQSPAIRANAQLADSIKSGHALSRYFFGRVKDMLKARGLTMEGWEELVVQEAPVTQARQVKQEAGYLNDRVLLDAWWNMGGNEDMPYRIANAGYPTVLACFEYLYFDLPNRTGFQEPGDAWIGYLDIDKLYSFIPFDYFKNNRIDVTGNARPASYFDRKERLTPTGQQHIVGMKGALWSENMVSDSLLDYMILPRLLALAERSWARSPAWATEKDSLTAATLYRKDWSVFANQLGKRELPRLDSVHGGANYRIPNAGMILRDGKVLANTQFPGFQIRYTTDGSEPTRNSSLYTTPLPAKGLIKLRVFNRQGRGSKTTEIENR
ncbi:family 20 glycosylhydrolase [Spirosoma gilvum]